MDTSSFVGGNTVLYFVPPPDRNISESTQRFQWVIPEDSVTFQQAERAPRAEARERPGKSRQTERKEGRKKEERRYQSGDGQILERKKVGAQLGEPAERERGGVGGKISRRSEGVRVLNAVEILEFIPCSNQSPLTWQACDKLSQRLYI